MGHVTRAGSASPSRGFAVLRKSGDQAGVTLNSDIVWASSICILSPGVTTDGTSVTLPTGTWIMEASCYFSGFGATNGALYIEFVRSSDNVAVSSRSGRNIKNALLTNASFNDTTVQPLTFSIVTVGTPTAYKLRCTTIDGDATATCRNVLTNAVMRQVG